MVSKERIDQWKNRGTVPWEKVVEYSRRNMVSLEYLINGHGPAKRVDVEMGIMARESGAIYEVQTNQDATYQIASQIYAALQKLGGTMSPEKFAQTMRLLHRGILDEGKSGVPDQKVRETVSLAMEIIT